MYTNIFKRFGEILFPNVWLTKWMVIGPFREGWRKLLVNKLVIVLYEFPYMIPEFSFSQWVLDLKTD